ncbi:MAG: ribbon-helix-helix protein, CopG family [Micrococcales bacterium]|nr:ribbon-helix-helix protein, CopG family [Micrococcales bacterium]
MSEHTSYRLGPDVPDEEELCDSQGRVIDECYVEQAVEEAIEQVHGRGRPSLSKSGESPLLRVRLPRELDEAVSDAARRAGASRSEWVRRALDEAVHRAS